MAVVTRPCGVLPCVRTNGHHERTTQTGWTLKAIIDFIKTQLCTLALTLTLFNTVRLPREAYKYGTVPYLVVYSFWLLVVGLPTVLLQLVMGQLSQQDPVGVWRAVPILRGVGHLKVMTSYLCCAYSMMLTALSAAYLIWIGKGVFPLKDCTKLHMTPRGYENKMNASECFNATFLAPFTEYPQYLGVMAILIFILWFFVPVLLFRLRKSLKVALNIFTPIIVVIAIILYTCLANTSMLDSMFLSCSQWMPLTNSNIWFSALVQVLLSTHIVGGYMISAGGTIYRQADVRWTSASVIVTNIVAGWLWMLFWEAVGDGGNKDTSFISTLVLIYQASVSEKRPKEWPLLQFGIVLVSGIITVLTLLFPVYDKLHRAAGDHWRLFATVSSAAGTALTVAILCQGLNVATMLDETVVPVLAVFTTALEIVGFVFIYGWCCLAIDTEFLTGTKLSFWWVLAWWITPVFLLGITGWWLRTVLEASWGQMQTLYPLLGVFIAILIVMVIMAAVAVAKEEQFNLLSKIASAFRPSRLWGPEEPLARYVWMSQRFANDTLSSENDTRIDTSNYAQIIYNKENEKKYHNEWQGSDTYQRNYYKYNRDSNDETVFKDVGPILPGHDINRNRKRKKQEDKFRSPNICLVDGSLGEQIECNCNRHFTLNVPDLRNSEVTTSL